MRILIIFLSFSFLSFGQRALKVEDKTLVNNQVGSFNNYYSSDLGMIKNNVFSPFSIIIKSYIEDENTLKSYRNELFSSLSALDFAPYQIGFSYNWKLGKTVYEKGVKQLYNSSSARQEIFNYGLKTYQNLSSQYPISLKKQLLFLMKEQSRFIDNYTQNRALYIQMANKETEWNAKNDQNYKDFKAGKKTRKEYDEFSNAHWKSYPKSLVTEIGRNNAWLYRRIENDKVPITELRSYINNLNKIVQNQLNSASSNYDCLKKTIINNEITVYDDFEDENLINLKSRSGNVLTIKSRSVKIKCIVSENKNYYLISFWDYSEKSSKKIERLYDSRLNEIQR